MYKVTRYSASVDHIYMQTVSRITRKMDNSSLQNGCKDLWMWSSDAKTANVTLDDKDSNKAIFNAPLQQGRSIVFKRAVILGTVPMNKGSHYWEVKLHKGEPHINIFVALGVATDKAIIHNLSCSPHDYIQDTNIWVMSSNSVLFHKGMACVDYTKPFHFEKETVIGLCLNKEQGTLSYYKDGHPLGIAFEGLDGVKDDLFPYATCMTGRIEMTLGKRTRIFHSLQERCRATIAKEISGSSATLRLPLPPKIKQDINDGCFAKCNKEEQHECTKHCNKLGVMSLLYDYAWN